MEEPENTQEPIRETRGQNNTESTSDHAVKEDNTANLPGSNGPKPESAPSGNNGEEEPNKPSKFKQMWGKLGLDLPTVMMMLKLVYTSIFLYYPLLFVHWTDMGPKGLNTPYDSYSLVSIRRDCRDIHDPWISRANYHSLVNGEYLCLRIIVV